jgi:DNA modification methylase
MPNITLMQGDCLDLMKQLPDGSVDMILCDLPYGCLNKNNPNTKWDSIIPFGSIWSEYCRIAKENAAIVLFGSGMFTADLMQSNRKMWRYNIVWDKVAKTGFLNAKKMPLRRHEDICVFYKKTPVYNPQMEKCPPHKRNHSKGNMKSPTKNRCYGNFVETPTIVSDEKYPTSIVSISKEHCNGKFFHPTQKPVALYQWILSRYAKEGDIILDTHVGSASSLIACHKMRFRFVGFEIDPEYYEQAKRRLDTETAQMNIFDFLGGDND